MNILSQPILIKFKVVKIANRDLQPILYHTCPATYFCPIPGYLFLKNFTTPGLVG